MKKLVTEYIFDASVGTVQLLGLNIDLSLEQVLLITNVTKGVIIHNFASTGGSINNNTLTLTYDTSLMADTDALQIYVDYPEERAFRVDWVGDTICYRGYAVVGALPSEPKWKITKTVFEDDGSLIVTWAEGETAEKYIWDNRAALTYR